MAASIFRLGHDLRGILAPAMLTSERLQANADPAVRRSADAMLRAVERASERLQSTVEAARGEALRVEREPFVLHDIIEQVAGMERGASATESPPGLVGVVVANDVSAELSLGGDPRLTATAIAELLRNAAAAGARRVTVSAALAAERVVVAVADDGPGLSRLAQDRLFVPNLTNGAAASGTGFGLAIVRDAMRSQGGDAVLDRTGADGTVFHLVLPRSAVRRPAV